MTTKSKLGTHTQCRMVKVEGDSKLTTVSWIPTEFAVLGKKLKLANGDRRADLVWTDGWVVEHVGSTISSEVALARERLHLKHREFSDI